MSKIPEGWRRVSLHEVATIQTGIAKGKSYNGKTVRVPYLRVANVQDGYLDLSEIKEIEVAPAEVERYKLNYEDVLLTEGGDFDKLGRGDVWRGQIPLCLHQNHIFVVRTDRKVLDPYFFSYQTASPYGRQYFLSASKQSTNLASINSTQLKEFPVLLPPLPVQRKIAAILSTWDEAIALTEQLIAALKQRKRALMQLLLTGQVRTQWEITTLDQIADIILSNVDKKTEEGEAVVRLCNYMDVFENDYIVDSMPFMEATANANEIHKFRLRKYDVVITKDSETAEDIAQAAVVVEDLSNVICGYHLAIIRPMPSKVFGPFLRELLSIPDVHFQFVKAANGVTRYGLTQSGIRNIAVPIPSTLSEQHKIAAILKMCDEETHVLHEYMECLKTQKRGLMQQLLTGAVRVAV